MVDDRNTRVIDQAVELFGTLLGQEIAASPLTPRDTTLMARSFPATVEIVDGPNGKIIRFKTPFYTKFVNDGIPAIRTRHFIQRILHQKGEELLKKAFRIASKQIQ